MNFPVLLLTVSRAVLGFEAATTSHQFVAIYFRVGAAGANRYRLIGQGHHRVKVIAEVHFGRKNNLAGSR